MNFGNQMLSKLCEILSPFDHTTGSKKSYLNILQIHVNEMTQSITQHVLYLLDKRRQQHPRIHIYNQINWKVDLGN